MVAQTAAQVAEQAQALPQTWVETAVEPPAASPLRDHHPRGVEPRPPILNPGENRACLSPGVPPGRLAGDSNHHPDRTTPAGIAITVLDDVADPFIQPDLQRALRSCRLAKMRTQRIEAPVQPGQPGLGVVHCEIEEDHNLLPGLPFATGD